MIIFSSAFDPEESGGSISFVSGVVNTDDIIKMKRMIYRASKGRACFETFDRDLKEDSHLKKIFMIIFPGSSEGVLMGKLLRICDLFNVSRYQVPSINEFKIEYPELLNDIKQKEHIMDESRKTTISFIREKIGEVSFLLF